MNRQVTLLTERLTSNKKVIILNGKAGSGKNEFVDRLNEYIPVTHYSYVDFTRRMLNDAGFLVYDKTNAMRKLCCDVNNALEEYGDVPFEDCVELHSDFIMGAFDTNVLIIDCREPEKIERLKNSLNAMTVFVDNINVPLNTSNPADASVMDYVYDYVVNNNGSLDMLEKEVEKFAEFLCGGMTK